MGEAGPGTKLQQVLGACENKEVDFVPNCKMNSQPNDTIDEWDRQGYFFYIHEKINQDILYRLQHMEKTKSDNSLI